MNGAALEVDVVADDALGADARRCERRGVYHGAVLDRGAGTDDDAAPIASQDRARPHGRLRSEGDVADHHGVRVHVGGWIDARLHAAQCVDSHLSGQAGVAAAEEHERIPLARNLQLADPAQHEVVVAGLDDGVDVAVDPCQHTIEAR